MGLTPQSAAFPLKKAFYAPNAAFHMMSKVVSKPRRLAAAGLTSLLITTSAFGAPPGAGKKTPTHPLVERLAVSTPPRVETDSPPPTPPSPATLAAERALHPEIDTIIPVNPPLVQRATDAFLDELIRARESARKEAVSELKDVRRILRTGRDSTTGQPLNAEQRKELQAQQKDLELEVKGLAAIPRRREIMDSVTQEFAERLANAPMPFDSGTSPRRVWGHDYKGGAYGLLGINFHGKLDSYSGKVESWGEALCSTDLYGRLDPSDSASLEAAARRAVHVLMHSSKHRAILMTKRVGSGFPVGIGFSLTQSNVWGHDSKEYLNLRRCNIVFHAGVEKGKAHALLTSR